MNMNNIATGIRVGHVWQQETFTKLDFIKTRLLLKIFSLMAFVVVLSLFYIWSRTQIVQAGYEINENMNFQERLLNQNKNLKMELGWLKRPERVRQLTSNSGLSSPGVHQLNVVE